LINVKSITIDDCYSINFLYITFTVSNMTQSPEKYKFDLYRSTNQSELFSLVAEDIRTFKYFDNTVNLLNINNQYYYKVKITEISTGETSLSDSYKYKVNSPDNWASAINFIQEFYLDNVINNDSSYLLQKKRTGQRCSCWNPNRDAVNNQQCTLCYGTGFVGGYYSPVLIKMVNYTANTYQRQFSISEDADTLTTQQVWIKSIPKVDNDDVIVNGNDRYIIFSHTDTMKNNYLLRQICSLNLIPKTNIISKVPIMEV